MENVQESEVESAFVILYDKLGRNRSEILCHLFYKWKTCMMKTLYPIWGAMQLNEELANPLEQNHALASSHVRW